MQNIETAASKFHGLLVAPGETFSMASAIGDITLDNGYAEALIIIGGQTIKGVGGGVCQVSTTLFRTAFFAGFPIVERYAHAYRVGYYEQDRRRPRLPSLAGLDATVFVPMVDFKFANDTPYWLLMETYVNGYQPDLEVLFHLRWALRWNGTPAARPTSYPRPSRSTAKTPTCKQGEIKQVDWAAEGADVTVNSHGLPRDGSVYFSDTIQYPLRGLATSTNMARHRAPIGDG